VDFGIGYFPTVDAVPSAGFSVIEPRLERLEKAIAEFTGEA
jgi:hypothetical protein